MPLAPLTPTQFYRPPSQSAAWMSYSQGFSGTLLGAGSGGLNDGDPVSSWMDISGNGNTATQSGSSRPTYKTNILNGKPVVRYASGQSLNLAGISSSHPWTCFTVWNPTAGVDTSGLASGSGTAGAFLRNDGYFIVGSPVAMSYYPPSGWGGVYHIHTGQSEPGSTGICGLWLDGGALVMTAFGTGAGSTFLYLGNGPSDIAEVIFYNSTISSTDRANIEAYLGNKYGITVAGGSGVQPNTVAGLVGWWNSDFITSVPSGLLMRLPRKALTATFAPIAALLKKAALARTSFTATLFQGVVTGIGTQVATDDFNRANQNPITGNWTNNVSIGGISIVSNAATATTLPSDGEAIWNTWASGNDQYSQAGITVVGTSATSGFGVYVRHSATASAQTGYRLVMDGAGNYELLKLVASTGSSLRTGTVTYSAGAKLGLAITGNTMTIWYNGSQVGASVTDSSSPLTTGVPGIGYSSTVTSGSIDNWDAGTTGGGSPSGLLTKTLILARNSFAATLSFIGALATNYIHGGGTLFTQSYAATLSFTGASLRRANKSLTVTLSFVGALAKTLSKFLTANLSFVGLVAKLSTRFLVATLSFIGSVTKQTTRFLTAALSFVGAMTTAAVHHFLQSYAATLSFVGSFSEKNVLTRFFTATLTSTAALSRSTTRALSATLSASASLIRRITRSLSATLSFTGTMLKAIRDAGFSATLSFVGNLTTAAVHFFTRAFAATLSFTGTLTSSRVVQRFLTATLAFSGALQRRTGKALAATLGFSTTAQKVVRKVLRGTLAFSAFFFKGGAVTVVAGWITKAFATIGITGSSAKVTKADSKLNVERTK